MIEAIDIVFAQVTTTFWVGMLVFLRVGSMMALVPAFGEQSVPVRVRLALGLAFTLVVGPAVGTQIGASSTLEVSQLGRAAAEVGTGLFFGALLRLFVLALQMAGAIAAQSTSLSQIFGGSAGTDAQPAIGHLLTIGGLTLAVMMGLHIRLAQFMIQSYELVPFSTVLDPTLVSQVGLERISKAFALGFSLAAPFVVASLIYNVTIGVINRAMPQLMVSFVGAPAITAGALALLAIAAPFLLAEWVGLLNAFLANPVGGI